MNLKHRFILPAVAAIFLGATALGSAHAADAASIKVKNDTSKTLTALYVSPSWASRWRSADQHLLYNVPPEYVASIEFAGGNDCDFDLYARMSDGSYAERDDVNLCVGDDSFTWTLTD